MVTQSCSNDLLQCMHLKEADHELASIKQVWFFSNNSGFFVYRRGEVRRGEERERRGRGEGGERRGEGEERRGEGEERRGEGERVYIVDQTCRQHCVQEHIDMHTCT